MKKQRVLFTALLSVLLLFLSVSCQTVKDVFTTVPNMRARASVSEASASVSESSDKTDLNKENVSDDISPDIQIFKLKKNTLGFEIAGKTVSVVHDGGRTITVTYPSEGDIIARATWDVLREEENGQFKGADTTFEPGKATVIFPKEITKQQFESAAAHAAGTVNMCYDIMYPQTASKDTKDTNYRESKQDLPVAEASAPAPAEVISDAESAVQANEEPNNNSEVKNTETPANDEKKAEKAVVSSTGKKAQTMQTKPPVMENAGTEIIIITIIIAIAASLVVYFSVIKKRKY